MKIHLISYGDNKYTMSKKRLFNEAKQTKWFDSITFYSPNDLDNDFKEKFSHILNQKRGGGYWIWKINIIQKKLKEIKENDILIYLDAGCTINPEGKKQLDTYIDTLNKSGKGILSFIMPYCIEKYWTTNEIFKYFNIQSRKDIQNTGQMVGGIRIMKKNKHLLNIMKIQYETLCNNPLLFTDYYNDNNKKNNFFRDNRHDQSILSCVCKLYGSVVFIDKSYCKPFGCKISKQYPFWATRKQ